MRASAGRTEEKKKKRRKPPFPAAEEVSVSGGGVVPMADGPATDPRSNGMYIQLF
uniref:Uncharacterized protein n=1 Tax=Oryza glumipatula TaxID=40148 RepID=A0A0D9Y4Q1_9ORYZ